MYGFKYIRSDLHHELRTSAQAAGVVFEVDCDGFVVVQSNEDHLRLEGQRTAIDERILADVLYFSSDAEAPWRAKRDECVAQGVPFIEYETIADPPEDWRRRPNAPSVWHSYGLALHDDALQDDIGLERPRLRAAHELLGEGVRPGKRTIVIYLLDDSASIQESSYAAARREAAGIEAWLASRSAAFASRFVLFGHRAREVTRDRFMTASKGRGATFLLGALRRCAEIAEAYPADEWDILVVLFSDGDTWSRENNLESIALVRERLLPSVVAFGYAQFTDPPGLVCNGQLIIDMTSALGGERRVVATDLTNEGDFVRAFVPRAESLIAT